MLLKLFSSKILRANRSRMLHNSNNVYNNLELIKFTLHFGNNNNITNVDNTVCNNK